jgi:hypothetical protein
VYSMPSVLLILPMYSYTLTQFIFNPVYPVILFHFISLGLWGFIKYSSSKMDIYFQYLVTLTTSPVLLPCPWSSKSAEPFVVHLVKT